MTTEVDFMGFDFFYEQKLGRAYCFKVQINSDEGSVLLHWDSQDPETFDVRAIDAKDDGITVESYGFPFEALAGFVDTVRAYTKPTTPKQ